MDNTPVIDEVVVSKKNILFEVTTFSKTLAAVLFIILPFAGFWAGTQYNQGINTDIQTVVIPAIDTEVPETKKVSVVKENHGTANSTYTKNNQPDSYKFSWSNTAVQLIDGTSGNERQSISLSDIAINSPKSSFSETYGSLSAMEKDQAFTPSIITDMDINFDGYIDIGILVDTGPIEDGYVFYLYDNVTKNLAPAILKENQPHSFVVYRPALNQDDRVLTGSFTVTNPRREDFYTYSYDAQSNTFNEKIDYGEEIGG